MTTNASRPPAKAEIQQHAHDDLRKTYLTVYTVGSVEVGDIVDRVHVNARYARELLGVLTNGKLILHPDESDTTIWTYNTDPFDTLADNDESAAEIFDQWAKENNLTPNKPAPAASPDATKAPRTPRTATRGTGTCLCGCGATTKGNYAPGHDARHAGQVAKALAEYLISNHIDPSESINDHGHALIAPLPSGALREKSWRIATGLVEKASTKSTADRKERETRDGDRPTVHIHEVMDEVAKKLAVEEALDPTWLYGTVRAGRYRVFARKDADGNIQLSKVRHGTDADQVGPPEKLPYTDTFAEGKLAGTFKVL